MKIIDNAHLAQMPYESVKKLTASGEEFVIRVTESTGERIQRFLKNEENYLQSPRSIKDRMRYFIGGLFTYPDSAFGSLWNRACMDGYRVTAIHKLEGCVEIHFNKPGV